MNKTDYSKMYNPAIREKAFDEVSHRLYFLVDLPCEEAFEYYMYITRQKAFDAIVTLSKLPKKEIKWIRDFMARSINFSYKISIDEKLNYIKELKKCVNSNQQ